VAHPLKNNELDHGIHRNKPTPTSSSSSSVTAAAVVVAVVIVIIMIIMIKYSGEVPVIAFYSAQHIKYTQFTRCKHS